MKTGAEHGDPPTAAARADVEMQIRGLMIDPMTNMPIVVLKDVASDTVLPIWVGIFEANAIQEELEKIARPRPVTHDLLRNMVRGLNAVVRKVVVSELRDDTGRRNRRARCAALRRHRTRPPLGLPHLRQPRRAGKRPPGRGRPPECQRRRDATLA